MHPRTPPPQRDALAGVRMNDPTSQASVSLACIFSAGGLTAHHVRVNTPHVYTTSWQGLPHYVALHDVHNSDCEILADDHPAARERDLRGRLAFVPSGCHAWGWMVPNRQPQSFTALFMEPASLEEELATRLQQLPQRARLYFFDVRLQSTLSKIRSCLEAATAPDRLYIEQLCLLAAIELLQWQADEEPAIGLSTELFTARVVEYMDQNLSRDMSLDDMARIAGLSRFHFLRAFKRAMKETPYQHLTRRRIERAQQMLRARKLSIAEIALAVGFKNSTRFAVAFRKMTSATPSAYRTSMSR